ncbi:hypothetical protein R1sor_020771 [Riccia sorocarpa]|uniref:Uncharacterized protein n=1 Tax=Riccia sorocarpa TaxID=122646 RepID=A0ABD3GIG7_9MARC
MRHGKFCWSCLDRLYFSDLSVRKVAHYPQFCLSDHLPISATFDLGSSVGEEERPKRSAYFKADKLVVMENLDTLKEVWHTTEEKFQGCRPADRFLKCWEAIRKAIKRLQYEKCARLNLLPEKERQLQSLIDKEPNTLTGEEKSRLGELMTEVRSLQAWKHHRWRQTCRDKFLKEGDACTAFFFQKFKKRKAKTNIKKLLGEGGQLLTSREEIKREVHRHYSSLYEAHDRGPEGATAAGQLLANINTKISREEKVLLDEVPTEQEITDSLHILPAGKSPGPDSISRETIQRIAALQDGAETRILFGGGLLPAFQANRIRPVLLPGNCRISCTCLADDLAVYTEVDHRSSVNLFRLFEKMEGAAGCKINRHKSKILLIGALKRPPDWLSCLGLQVVGKDQCTRYLGVSLTTAWRGVDNGTELIARITKKAESYSHPLLSFELRVVALKHAVFAPLIYHVLSARFKAGTLKRANSVLRDYIWSKDETGKKKKALTCWDSLTVPECWGGLGLLEIQEFQHALLIRTFFKGIQNPSQSIWLPILTSVFWKGFSGDIVQTLCLQEPPRNLKQCPLTNLLLEAWGRFISLYRWHPAENKIGPTHNIRQCCFLTARKFLDVQEAGRVAGMIAAWAKENNIRSTPQLTTRLASGNHPFTHDDDGFLLAVLRELQGATVLQALPTADLSDWTGHAGNNLDLSQRASAVHMKLAMGKENAQADRFNTKWRVFWPVSAWRQVWKVFTLKGLGNKHKVFLWRVLTKAFFDGRKERLMGLPSFACEFCKQGEEDVHHIFLCCPRWEPFWQEIGTRLQGWGEFLQLRRSGATIPQLFIWAATGNRPEAWLKTWTLATIWRTLWDERCLYKYQGKCNNLHFLKLAYTMIEELAAKRDSIRKDHLQLALRRLLTTLPVIPKRDGYKNRTKKVEDIRFLSWVDGLVWNGNKLRVLGLNMDVQGVYVERKEAENTDVMEKNQRHRIPRSASSPDIQKSYLTKTQTATEMWVDGLILAYELIPAPKNRIKVGGKFGQKSGPMRGNFSAEITLDEPKAAPDAQIADESWKQKKSPLPDSSVEEDGGAVEEEKGEEARSVGSRGEEREEWKKKQHDKWVPIGWERIGELCQLAQSNIISGKADEMMLNETCSEDCENLTVADQAAPYWQKPVGPTWWCHVDPCHPHINSWLMEAQWLHPAISAALLNESRLISDRMKHLYYEVPVRVSGGILLELLGQSVGDPHRNEDDVPIVLRSWASQNFLVTALHVKGDVPSLNVIGISEVQDLVSVGGFKAPKTSHEVIALLADRLATWDDRLFRKHYFGAADEVELKFVSRRRGEDLAILSLIINQEIRRLSSQVIRVKWALHAREEIVYELMTHLRGIKAQTVLESTRESTRHMLDEQGAVRNRLFTLQDAMQSAVREGLQDKSIRIQHNLTVIGGPGLLLTIVTGLFGINVGGIPGEDQKHAFLIFTVVFSLVGAMLIAVGMIYLGLQKLPTEEQLAARRLELQELVKHFQESAEGHEKVKDVVETHHGRSLGNPVGPVSDDEYILILT